MRMSSLAIAAAVAGAWACSGNGAGTGSGAGGNGGFDGTAGTVGSGGTVGGGGNGAGGNVGELPLPGPLPQQGVFHGVAPIGIGEYPPTMVVGFSRTETTADVVLQFGRGAPVRVAGTVDGDAVTLPPFWIANHDEQSDPCYSYGGTVDAFVIRGAQGGIGVFPEGSLSAYELDVETYARLEAPFLAEPLPTVALGGPTAPGAASTWVLFPSEPITVTAAWFDVGGTRVDASYEPTDAPLRIVKLAPARPLPWGTQVTARLDFTRASGETGTARFAAEVLRAPDDQPVDPELSSLAGIASTGLTQQTDGLLGSTANGWDLGFEADVPDSPTASLRVTLRALEHQASIRVVALGATGRAETLERTRWGDETGTIALDVAGLRGEHVVVGVQEDATEFCPRGPCMNPIPRTLVESIELVP